GARLLLPRRSGDVLPPARVPGTVLPVLGDGRRDRRGAGGHRAARPVARLVARGRPRRPGGSRVLTARRTSRPGSAGAPQGAPVRVRARSERRCYGVAWPRGPARATEGGGSGTLTRGARGPARGRWEVIGCGAFLVRLRYANRGPEPDEAAARRRRRGFAGAGPGHPRARGLRARLHLRRAHAGGRALHGAPARPRGPGHAHARPRRPPGPGRP